MTMLVPVSDVAEVNPSPLSPVSGRVSFVPMADVSEDGFLLRIQERDAAEMTSGYRYFEQNDVLVAKITPCMENGKVAIARDLPQRIGFGSTEFHVLRPTPAIDGRYLFYMVWNPYFRATAARNMTGTAGQRRVPTSFFETFKIPLPPLPEQKRIAAILNKADAIRLKRRESLRLLDDFLRSVFLDMFGDPVKNPKGWEQKPLRDLCVIRRGASPRPIQEYLGGSVPWIKIGDGTQGGDLYIDRTTDTITKEGAAKSVFLEPEALIFANSGVSLGFARILKIGGCIHDGWLALERISPALDKIFLLKLLNSVTERFRRMAPEGTQPNLNTEIMKAFQVILPTIDEQRAFASMVLAADRMKVVLEKQHQSPDTLFHSLLQRAFRGEL